MWALPLVLLLLCGTGVIGQDYPAVNGYTVRQGDCPGNDIWSIYGDGVTLETCAERCSNHRDCVSFMFYDNRVCYPKTQTCAETDKSNPRNVFYDKGASILNTADAVGLWALNSQYGSSDATGNGNDGVARGTQLATGPNGDANGAFLFSGRSSSYIDIPNNGRLDVQSSYTILAHIYPTGEAGPIVNYVGNNNGWAVHLWQTPSRTLFMRTIGRDGHFSSGVGADVLRPSDWNYVGGTYDSNTGMSSIWNDGEMVSQKQIGVSTVATQYPIRVAVREGDSRYFAGRIACIQLYDYAMSQEQIVAARDRCAGNANGGSGKTVENTESSGLSGGAIAGIVIGVLVGVGLLAVMIHHCNKTSSQPTPANRANPNPQTVGMNTVVHSPTVVSQNPSYNPYPPPPQYAPPPAYNTALNMPTQPPGSLYSPSFPSSLDPAYPPPPEPFKYGVT
ncbi:Hypp6038 [Branchiostoma lanceolatum]|uniref:Hypp6038 protein n=1 Tax=Branchiostoma lanceolatum TaxID=7740 RepID=A0A8J9YNC6_BRALA|nr:Hypp6038 [Branchiostoma lanceolatum]